MAIVQGAPLARGFAFPRQSNEFYYLSGIETPGAYILLDGRTRKSTLILPPRNERLERNEGKVLVGRRRRVGHAPHRRRRRPQHEGDG